MKQFYTWVVHTHKAIFVLFLLLAGISLLLQPLVSVNYDINDYLPPDSDSTVSLDIMEQEFSGGIPNARVMIANVTIPQALEYKEQLKSIPGVQEVTWLDDAVDITVPIQTLDQDTVETYYQEPMALFTVTIAKEQQIEAVEAIQAMVGQQGAVTGSAVSTAIATTSTVTEVQKISIFAVLFVLIVLTITTNSWLEPILVLLGVGVAIIINSGTNLIFGEISFVTNAAGSILQLAVSLDYSVFLIHRFEESRKQFPGHPDSAMIDALCKSTTSILSSGLTTVIGFLALVLMRFQIGPDLGLALAKGVAISLITVFLFMPAVILMTYRLLDKTHHKPFVPDFHRFAKIVQRVMFPVTAIFLLLIIPSYLASNSNEYYYGSSHIFGEDTRLGADTAAIEHYFGKSDTYVLLVPNGDTATEKALSYDLHQIPEVTSIISYVDLAGAEIPLEYLDTDTLSKLVSEHFSRMVITVDADLEGSNTFALVQNIREIAQAHYPDQWHLVGEGVSTFDLKNTITDDMAKVNLLAIGAVFLVLVVMMKSLFLPLILVTSIETAIWINLSLPYFSNTTVFYISYLIISSVQLGATVDYAILLTDRYREFRQSMNKKQAMIETLASSTVSIITTGSVLAVVGFLMGLISTHGLLAQLGMFLGVGAVCSLIIVLFVLPGLLYTLDFIIMRKQKKVS